MSAAPFAGLPLLAEAGVDGVEGIAGPPQSDITLAEARQLAGPGITLWGGIRRTCCKTSMRRKRSRPASPRRYGRPQETPG